MLKRLALAASSAHDASCSPTYKFTGYEYDSAPMPSRIRGGPYRRDRTETGDYYAYARYYNPRLGRFMRPDPLGGSIMNPQSLNGYTYVLNNPTSFTDPTGLVCEPDMPNANCGSESQPHGGGFLGYNESELYMLGFTPTGYLDKVGNCGDPTSTDCGYSYNVPVYGNMFLVGNLPLDQAPVWLEQSLEAPDKQCTGKAKFSAPGPHQAHAGALARFGILGHQTGGVAVNPSIFGLYLPGTMSGNTAVQARLAMLSPFVRIFPSGLNLHGGPSPPYHITDIGDRNIRNSVIPRFDLYGLPTLKSALQFGLQTVPTTIMLPNTYPCPTGFSEVQ